MADLEKYLQPYSSAVKERMERIEVCPARNGHPRRLTSSERVLVLSLRDATLVATNLAGSEVWSIRCLLDHNCRVAELKEFMISRSLVTADTFALFVGDAPARDEDSIEEMTYITIKVTEVRPTVFVSVDNPRPVREAILGEGSIDFDVMPQIYSLVQAVQEGRQGITGGLGSERYQYLHWLVYQKDEVKMTESSRMEPFTAVGIFPARPCWPLPDGAKRFGGGSCDIWKASLTIPSVKQLLHEHASLTKDRPIPRYQMIVDPNKFVRSTPQGQVWVPCEFDVNAHGSPHLVGGGRSHAFPHLAEKVAAPIFHAALPLLAQLDRPRLLLNERRLQVVFKAQRIIVPPKVSENADSEYVGLWHVDGMLEHVAAVVLYYYHVDDCLRGGDMEFCGREPADVLGWGDCSNNFRKLRTEAIRNASEERRGLNFCRVPIEEGTLLVFSNYQFVHRVLRMINESMEREASRDFVALFVIDPAVQPLVPARVHLSKAFMVARTLKPMVSSAATSQSQEKKAKRVVTRILEFLDMLPTSKRTAADRAKLLREQLRPQGKFGCCDGHVYATGNGCYTMIGWINNMLDPSIDCHMLEEYQENAHAWDRFVGLNVSPQQLGRGASEILSAGTGSLEELVSDFRYNCKYESLSEA